MSGFAYAVGNHTHAYKLMEISPKFLNRKTVTTVELRPSIVSPDIYRGRTKK